MVRVIPQTPPDFDKARVIERPDGFYWQSAETGAEYGPFKTLAAAVEDMELNAAESDEVEAAETLEEAEAEMGIGWIDPETGEAAEEWAPRIEDH
jgi:hypothetical protein